MYFVRLIKDDVYLNSNYLTIEQLHRRLKIEFRDLLGILVSLENSNDIQIVHKDSLVLITEKGKSNLSDKIYLKEYLKFKSKNLNYRIKIIKNIISSILVFAIFIIHLICWIKGQY